MDLPRQLQTGIHLALRRPGRLEGEHLYEDKSTLKIEQIDPADAITPPRVREIHKECLAAYEQRFGPEYGIIAAEADVRRRCRVQE